jgi:hypothetical protein
MSKLAPIPRNELRSSSKLKPLRLGFFFLLSGFPDSLADFLNLPNDVVEVRPFAGDELGMERFAIDGNFKGAATRWDEGERADAIAEFENLGRQTDGLRRVISDHAVFDSDFVFHATLLSEFEPSGWRPGIKQATNLESLSGRRARKRIKVRAQHLPDSVRQRPRSPRAFARSRPAPASAGASSWV